MEPQFWYESWEQGGIKTSFHRPDVHPFVKKHASSKFLADKRVFVPLAGKTNAIAWFRRYAAYTVAVELVEKPIHEFFDEHLLPYENKEGGRFEAKNLTFFNRNLFDLTTADVGPIDFVYDRASLIAFPHNMRLDYLQKLDELCPVGSQTLLITLEYEPDLDTPPFTLTIAEVYEYYGQRYEINHVEQVEQPNHGMKRKWGLDFVKEHGFILTKRA